MLYGDLDGWGRDGRGRICIHTADSLLYTVETIQHCKATIPPPPPQKKSAMGNRSVGIAVAREGTMNVYRCFVIESNTSLLSF